ncbi:urease accessory protein UreE [Chelatococcus asaccharovorans]|uniref:Urease accessory protein UreE n=1 Tax=Chelatococcus asaccharovorans TaxID=28210 RepID=A0A2V3TVH9_9HYPH|nr:urease accessory protein UreE [Chelatococcus asaccharovorans]MBS7702553.1 urease accessory protein UreE [Chelatococcus asaccharovorans]PXW52155.1 urease accessory protein [Chelatococcus asaccharovorans]
MTKATGIVRKAAVKADRIVDTVTLDHIARDNPPADLTAEAGLNVHLHLPEGSQLNDGDAFKLEDGKLVAVKAADEKLIEVKAENPLRLMRVLWHLGQNHTAVEVTNDAIYVAQDDAVAELIRGQGCSLVSVERPFRPERAIAGHDCGHDHHGHHHGHAHHDHHGHEHHGHAHHEHAHHDHGACGCGHDHHDHAGDHHEHDDHGKGHQSSGQHGHDHHHEDDAAHGHRHHSHAHHGHDHGKDGH